MKTGHLLSPHPLVAKKEKKGKTRQAQNFQEARHVAKDALELQSSCLDLLSAGLQLDCRINY